ncbi:MAG: preprotein translocase subunit SecG [Acidiferrobacterales bacterium]
MQELVLVLHVLAAVGLVTLVLLQQGKGADVGAAFGSGASQTLFGARGSANFLTRVTAVLATVFFITSMTLTAFALRGTAPPSVTQGVTVEEVVTEPAAQEETPAIPESTSPPGDVPEVPR